jgi:hypothetical protein
MAVSCREGDNDPMARGSVSDLVERLGSCLSARAEVLDAYLFGSQARGVAAQHSDLDVAVYLDEKASASYPFGYRADLAAEVMRCVRRDDVDIVVLNQAPPLLYQRVLRDGVRILSRDLAATTVREGRALSRYCDYLPQLRKIEAQHAARIERGSFGR